MPKEPRVFILAPTALDPALDGGSLRSLAFKSEFDRAGYNTTWLGGQRTDVPGHSHLPPPPSKQTAAALTLGKLSNYCRERSITPAWRSAWRIAAEQIHPGDIVWCNFVWSYPEVPKLPQLRVYIDTHNSEREWYESVSQHSRNPLAKLAAKTSTRYSENIVRSLPNDVTCVHVSAEDKAYYESLAPRCRHVIVPNGCRLKSLNLSVPRNPGHPRLYFLGSLGVTMNQDALENFSSRFWPQLKDSVEFHVFGSSPAASVIALCEANQWPLHQNLPEDALDACLSQMDVAVMPFAYGAGSKLKLVDALARGKFVLSTPEGAKGITRVPATVMIEADPAGWKPLLQNLSLPDPNAAQLSHAFAENYSWPGVIGGFLARESL